MKEFEKLNYRQMERMMGDEEYCHKYLVYKRWNGTPRCPNCLGTHVYTYKPWYKYKCADKSCDRQFTVTAGTIFEKTRIPLKAWFRTIECCVDGFNGYPARNLVAKYGFSEETAWFMHHRIMELFRVDMESLNKQGGIWEIDVKNLGPNLSKMSPSQRKKYNKRGGHSHRVPATVLVNRSGNVYIRAMKNQTKVESDKVIDSFVRHDSTIYTDGAAIYKKLGDRFHRHVAFNRKKKQHSDGKGGHINTANAECSLFESVIETYVKLGRKYMQRYLDEFCFNRNHRKLTLAHKFSKALDNMERPLSIKELIN